jgi:multidrug efflux pump subunit AcrA (membrane-fusion protein)
MGARSAAAACCALALLLLGGCHSGPDRRFAAEPVSVADVVERVSAPGSVQAAAQADVKAPADARVDRLLVPDGAKVTAGQVLAKLASTQVDDSLRQAQAAADAADATGGSIPGLPAGQAAAALGQVQAQVNAVSSAVLQALRSALPLLPAAQRAQLQASLDRATRQLAAAEAETDQAVRQVVGSVNATTRSINRTLQAAAGAQQAQARLALQVAQDQKARLTVRAPIAGTVQLGRAGAGGQGSSAAAGLGLPEGAQQALQGLTGGGAGGGVAATGPPLRAGTQVAAGQTVATVYDVASLGVATEVDETDIALVRPGERAEVELDAFPGATFAARVSRVAVAPTPGGAAGGVSYQVDLALGPVLAADTPAGDGADAVPVPRVGMTATAEIEVRRAGHALSVPSSALVGRGGGQAVFVVEGGRVHLRPVRIAANGDDRVAIASGLRDGERVVSRGAERLRDGQAWPGPA